MAIEEGYEQEAKKSNEVADYIKKHMGHIRINLCVEIGSNAE